MRLSSASARWYRFFPSLTSSCASLTCSSSASHAPSAMAFASKYGRAFSMVRVSFRFRRSAAFIDAVAFLMCFPYAFSARVRIASSSLRLQDSETATYAVSSAASRIAAKSARLEGVRCASASDGEISPSGPTEPRALEPSAEKPFSSRQTFMRDSTRSRATEYASCAFSYCASASCALRSCVLASACWWKYGTAFRTLLATRRRMDSSVFSLSPRDARRRLRARESAFSRSFTRLMASFISSSAAPTRGSTSSSTSKSVFAS